jgi:hypothetical protein
MMARSGPRRERAIIAVLRTGRIPGQNVTRSGFCDLVRIAARVTAHARGVPPSLEQRIHHERGEQDQGRSCDAL